MTVKKPIIARVFGGLGNQMFIYANARAIALRNQSPLLLDVVTGFRNDPYRRSWGLQHFDIQYLEAGNLESFNFTGGKVARKALREFNKNVFEFNYITEKNFEKFDPSIKNLKLRHTTWIEGYWQSPKYFEDHEETIRKELSTIISTISEESRKVARNISKSHSVCLHARRLRNELVGEENAKIKTLSLDYYYKAIERIARDHKDVHFFCFSDAPEWLEKNLKIDYPATFVGHNIEDSKTHEDMWLMSQCQHFIISNSTFAWWGAWLGKNKNKSVISPGYEYWDCKESLPKNWNINI